MYLVDSNIFVEFLLGQERANEVERLFQHLSSTRLFITEFSLYSIGIILVNDGKLDLFVEFVEKNITKGRLHLIRLRPQDINMVAQMIERFNLDFDDAYQYTAAERYDLQILSFDSDFNKTERGRVTPQQILDMLKKQQ